MNNTMNIWENPLYLYVQHDLKSNPQHPCAVTLNSRSSRWRVSKYIHFCRAKSVDTHFMDQMIEMLVWNYKNKQTSFLDEYFDVGRIW